MKPLILLSSLLVFLGCQKSINEQAQFDIPSAEAYLKKNMSSSTFRKLDFANAVIIPFKEDSLHLVKVPFTNDAMHFAVVRIEANDICTSGKVIKLTGSVNEQRAVFNGNIRRWSLDETLELDSDIENGVIRKFHPPAEPVATRSLKPDVVPDPYTTLPEVVVVAYISGGSGISYATWVSLLSLMGSGTGAGGAGSYGGNATGGYYSNISDGYSGGGGGSGTKTEPPIWVDAETANQNPSIDVSKYLSCFNNIPDNGASCSIELFTDIPVDTDPTVGFNWSTGFPGHVFLNIKKSNGNQSVSQNIGFYPVSAWKTTLTTAPIAGKFVDNSKHGFNASIKMDLSPAQLRIALEKMEYLSKFVKYDIDDYNCTDFALEVFNSARSSALNIQKMDIPGAMAPQGSNTPQGLYLTLQQMKQAGSPEASNIWVSQYQGLAGNSSGPCAAIN